MQAAPGAESYGIVYQKVRNSNLVGISSRRCMLIFIFLAMNVKYCLTINPVMWFRFMGEDFNILPAWHVDQSVKYSAR